MGAHAYVTPCIGKPEVNFMVFSGPMHLHFESGLLSLGPYRFGRMTGQQAPGVHCLLSTGILGSED